LGCVIFLSSFFSLLQSWCVIFLFAFLQCSMSWIRMGINFMMAKSSTELNR
jgi:hypothetical protein